LKDKTFYADQVNVDEKKLEPHEVAHMIGFVTMTNYFARGPLTAQPDPMGVWGYDR